MRKTSKKHPSLTNKLKKYTNNYKKYDKHMGALFS